MSWLTVQQALHTWVRLSSGLAATSVLWGEQRLARPKPPTTWVEMSLGALRPTAIHDARVQLDVEDDLEETPVAGEEIEIRTVGYRESSLAIQVFGPALGATSARAIAEKIQAALGLPTIHDALEAAGISVFDNGSITNVPRVLETDWEGRAVLTVRLQTIAEAAERTGYIATVNVELAEQGIEFEAP